LDKTNKNAKTNGWTHMPPPNKGSKMKTGYKQKFDPLRLATPEQRRALELVGLTAKAMNTSAADEKLAGNQEAARAIKGVAKALEKAHKNGGPQQRLMAVAEVIAHLEGSAQRASESGRKKLGGYMKTFAMELRTNVAESVKKTNEKPRKRRKLPLPKAGKGKQRKLRARARAYTRANAA
jgi:hypothetical protein